MFEPNLKLCLVVIIVVFFYVCVFETFRKYLTNQDFPSNLEIYDEPKNMKTYDLPQKQTIQDIPKTVFKRPLTDLKIAFMALKLPLKGFLKALREAFNKPFKCLFNWLRKAVVAP